MSYFQKKIIILTLLHFSTTFTDNTINELKKEHLKNFTANPYEKPETISLNWYQKIFSVFQKQKVNHAIPSLSDYNRYNITYNLFSAEKESSSDFITSTRTWNDLQLITNDSIKNTLFFIIDRTQTTAGKVFLAHRLTHPTDSIEEIKKRQFLIQYLIEHKELYEKIQLELATIKKHEEVFLNLWQEEIDKEALDTILEPLFWNYSNIFSPLNNLNQNQSYQETMSIIRPTWTITKLLGEPITTVNTMYLLFIKNILFRKNDYFVMQEFERGEFTPSSNPFDFINTLFKSRYEFYKSLFSGQWIPQKEIIQQAWEKAKDTATTYPLQFSAGSCAIVGLGTYWVYSNTYAYRKQLALQNYLHEKMNCISAIIRAKNNISTLIKQHPDFNSCLTYSEWLDKTDNEVVNSVCNLLETNTFSGNPTNLSRTGRIITAYEKIRHCKDNFGQLFIALGEIDTTISTTALYKEHQQTTTPFTFVVCKISDKPFLTIKNMWNPFIPSKYIVKNSVTLGLDEQPRNAIITGPNAGGKSTFLKGNTLTLILAQSIGLAPADYVEFTPFSAIETYMNIVDNISFGQSLFKAEVIRTKELLQTINALKNENKFIFVVLDEIFTGTEPEAAKKISYEIADSIGKKDNCLALLATHFYNLPALEENTQNYKNYKVTVNYDNNNKMHYTFKIEPGIADQNVVNDILKDEGFEDLLK